MWVCSIMLNSLFVPNYKKFLHSFNTNFSLTSFCTMILISINRSPEYVRHKYKIRQNVQIYSALMHANSLFRLN